MVLFLFVIMLLNLNADIEPHKSTMSKVAAVIAGGLLLVILVCVLKGSETIPLNTNSTNEIGLVKNLGKVLYQKYTLPFELVSLLFLAAIIGAVMLGKKEIK